MKYKAFFVALPLVFSVFFVLPSLAQAQAFESCARTTIFNPAGPKYSILDPLHLEYSVNEQPSAPPYPPLVWPDPDVDPNAPDVTGIMTLGIQPVCTPLPEVGASVAYAGFYRDSIASSTTRLSYTYFLGHLVRAPFTFDPPPGCQYYYYNQYWRCSDPSVFVDNQGFGVKVDIPALSSSSFLSGVTAEDAVIEKIASDGVMTITASVPSIGASRTFTVPATNCVKLSGNGPRKIVFMRGNSWDSSVAGFVAQANNVISNGFGAIDPFKTYIGQFSFYADLKKFDDSGFPIEYVSAVSGFGIGFQEGITDSIKTGNSCNSLIGKDNQYLFFIKRADLFSDGYAFKNKGIAFFNLQGVGTRLKNTDVPPGLIHEFGHSFSGLLDEYIHAEKGNIAKLLPPGEELANCTLKPKSDYRNSVDGKIYGSVSTEGCTCIQTDSFFCSKYYRPSQTSIMNIDQVIASDVFIKDPRFNVISCGYVIAAIKGESTTKQNAQKYWPECLTMANQTPPTVIKDGIPPANPTTPTLLISTSYLQRFPNLAALFSGLFGGLIAQAPPVQATSSGGPGFPATLLGTGFTVTGNAVQFTNTTTGNYYETLDIPSNGTTLTFNVPADAPPGTYTVKAGAFNSGWSNSIPFTVSSPVKPVVSVTASPTTLFAGQSTTINWMTAGVTSCTGRTIGTTTPWYWESPTENGALSGSFLFTPDASQDTTFYLGCTGQGGTASGLAKVTVSSQQAPPQVALSATPTTITTLGQGTALAWATTFASSCQGSGSGLSTWDRTQSITGSGYFVPNQSTAFNLSCTGTGGIASSTIFVTTPTAPTLSATCSVFPTGTVARNQLATFTAVPTGGTGSYTYSWTGTDNLVGSARSTSLYYSSSGAKTASVVVTSGGLSTTATCPTIQFDSSLLGPRANNPGTIAGISPTSGPAGTTVTLTGYPASYQSNYFNGITTVVVERGGQTLYIKPASVNNPSGQVVFNFTPSLPLLPASPGTVYSVSLQNHVNGSLVRTAPVSFTLTNAPAPVPPWIANINPVSGLHGTTVTLGGTGFVAGNTVIIATSTFTSVIIPTSITGTSLTFPFLPTVPIFGPYSVRVSNQGATSNAVTFALTAPPINPNPPPMVSLSASQTVLTYGQSTTISWITSGAYSCQGSTIGTPAPSSWASPQLIGSFSFTPTQNTTLTLSCTGTGGTTVQNVSVTVPVSITLTASATTKGQVNLNWSDNSQTETAFLVERSRLSPILYAQIAGLPANSTSYTDIGLPPSTTFKYRVRVRFADGSYSNYSPVANIKTLLKPATPVLSIGTITDRTINLSWTDADSAVIAGYTLAKTTPSPYLTLLNVAPVTTYQVTGLNPSTRYCFQVSASVNEVNKSATTTNKCAITLAPSPSPSIVPTALKSSSENTTPAATKPAVTSQAGPSATVLSPNGGETISISQPITVTFRPLLGVAHNINLWTPAHAYSLSSLTGSLVIGQSTEAQSISVTIPASYNVTSGQYKIEICATLAGGTDTLCAYSNDYFTVTTEI